MEKVNLILLAYFRTPRVQIAALLYFLLAGALTQVPLFNYLGYEFSALMAIPTALVSGIITIQFLREHRTKPLTRRTWLAVTVDYLHVNFLLLLIPLVIILLNALSVKNCNVARGVAYYVLLPICTMVFSVALALVIGTLFRKAILVFCLTVAAILLHILFITYTQPQIFAYNFILGFFPGITYDETLSDKNTLIIFREFTLVAVLMLICLFAILIARFSRHEKFSANIQTIKHHFAADRKLWIMLGICVIILAAGHFYRDKMGYEFTAADIQKQLGRRSESDHFIFYYSRSNYSPDEMVRIKGESEYHFNKVIEQLQTRNPDKKKISIYIYPDNEVKRKFIGTSNTNIAKPWRSEIHLTKNSFASTFRHELVHALAADFGFPIIRGSLRMGLNEGLAVAVDWHEGIFTPHEYAAALQREKLLDNAGQLFTIGGFAVQSSTYAYLVSGSFCKYLLERFGIERFKHAFANGNFVLAFGERLESLIKDWKVFLRTVDASAIPSSTVKSLFLQQSIFYKTCAREVAEENERAVRAIRVSNYSLAESMFTISYDHAQTVYALSGLFHTFIAQKKFLLVIEKFSSLPSQSLLKINPTLLLQVGDAYLLNDQNAEALKFYNTIRKMNISESSVEASAVRIQFIKDRCSSAVFFQLYYHANSDSAKLLLLNDSHNIRGISLLYHKALYQQQGSEERINDFLAVAGFSANNDLCYFSLVRSANQLYSQSRFEEAKMLYWQAKNYSLTPASSGFLDERIELCESLKSEI